MKDFTRRNFVQKSTLVSLGAAAIAGGIALGETDAEVTLRAMDPDLARELRSYGRTRAMQEIGTQKAVVDSKTRVMPAFRVEVGIANPSFCRSLEALSRLNVLFMAKGNTLRFTRGGRYFVIENRVV